MFVSEQCSICGESYNLSKSKPENTGLESDETPAISSSGTRTGDVIRKPPYGHRSPFSIPRSFNIREQTLCSYSPMLSSPSYLILFVFLLLCMQLHSQGSVHGHSLPESKSLPMNRIFSTHIVGRSKNPVSLYTEQDSTNNTYKLPIHKTSNDLYLDPCKAGRTTKISLFLFLSLFHAVWFLKYFSFTGRVGNFLYCFFFFFFFFFFLFFVLIEYYQMNQNQRIKPCFYFQRTFEIWETCMCFTENKSIETFLLINILGGKTAERLTNCWFYI